MNCPKCAGKSLVINSRSKGTNTAQIRYRCYKCEMCDTRYTTYEKIHAIALNSYDACYERQEYKGQDCKKCPHIKECGGQYLP